MIPKIIHYCWFGNNEKPQLVKDCISSWKIYLPDFEIIEWNETNTDLLSNSFVKNAYKLKKWAFVSDYIRLQKLSEIGGIYLDTDMLFVKKLNSIFLHSDMFISCENDSFISAGIIGAKKNYFFIEKLLDYYNNININKFTNLFEITIPKIITQEFRKEFNYNGNFKKTINLKSLKIFPSEYFYSLPSDSSIDKKKYKKYLTDNSYAVHLWGESWVSKNEFELLRRKEYYLGFKQAFYSFNHQKNKVKYIRKILSSIKQSLKQ